MSFRDRVALVTGGASGIGAATVRRLAAAGARVVVADLDAQGAHALAAELTASGQVVVAAECDQTDPAQVEALFADTLARYERLDVLFANAGWCQVGPFLDIPPTVWQRTFDINVTGTFSICQAAARRMIECGNGGAIIVTTSSGAVVPAALFAAYCSAKAALNMLVQVMAYELGAHDIRVNAVMPGPTETAMTKALLATGAGELFSREVPLGRVGRPEDVARAVTYLASDDAAYITGTSMLIDGGGAIPASWFVTDFSKRGTTDWSLRHEALAAGHNGGDRPVQEELTR